MGLDPCPFLQNDRSTFSCTVAKLLIIFLLSIYLLIIIKVMKSLNFLQFCLNMQISFQAIPSYKVNVPFFVS